MLSQFSPVNDNIFSSLVDIEISDLVTYEKLGQCFRGESTIFRQN